MAAAITATRERAEQSLLSETGEETKASRRLVPSTFHAPPRPESPDGIAGHGAVGKHLLSGSVPRSPWSPLPPPGFIYTQEGSGACAFLAPSAKSSRDAREAFTPETMLSGLQHRRGTVPSLCTGVGCPVGEIRMLTTANILKTAEGSRLCVPRPGAVRARRR